MATTHTRFLPREEFDASRSFIARRAMRVGGVDYRDGEDFDKHAVPIRRLRQLFENRKINMKPLDEAAATPETAPEKAGQGRKPQFRRMDDENLRRWLADQGSIPRATWGRPKLLERCNEVWNGLKASPGHG